VDAMISVQLSGEFTLSHWQSDSYVHGSLPTNKAITRFGFAILNNKFDVQRAKLQVDHPSYPSLSHYFVKHLSEGMVICNFGIQDTS
jgi:hypothetical protein